MTIAQPGPSSTDANTDGGGSEGICICIANTAGTCMLLVSILVVSIPMSIRSHMLSFLDLVLHRDI